MDYPDVFLSYCDDASEVVTRVEKFFDGRGRDVYSFRREDNLPGEELRNRIGAIIKRCRYVLVVASLKAKTSPWIEFEVLQATEANVPIIPIKAADLAQEDVPESLQQWPWINSGGAPEFENNLEAVDRKWGYIDVYLPAGGFPGTKIEFSDHVPKSMFPVGDRPMLFHVLESLVHRAFGNAVVINRREVCWEYLKYLTRLNSEFPLRVEFKEFAREDVPDWPWALKSLAPSRVFVLQLCDVLLSLSGETQENVLRQRWGDAFGKHIEGRKQYGKDYMGTLLVSENYNLSVGTVKFKHQEGLQIVDDTGENPRIEELGRYYVNTGTAILEPEILKYIEKTDASVHGEAVVRARKDNKVFGTSVWGNWHHLLNINDYAITHWSHLGRSLSQPRPEMP